MDKLTAEARKELNAEMQKRNEEFQASLAPPNIADISADEVEEMDKIMTAAEELFDTSTIDAQPIFEAYFFGPEEDNEDAPKSEDDVPDE